MLNQAVFLFGGKGTRLGPLTIDTPKPLLGIGGMSFLRRLMDEVYRYGIEDMVLLGGYKVERLEQFLAENNDRPYRIRLVVEPKESGTGGALIWARDILNDRFFLFNGDSFFDINLLDFEREAKSFPAMLALRNVVDAGRFGSVEVVDNRVVRFREKVEGSGEGLINGGVYILDKTVLAEIEQIPCSLENEVFPKLIESARLGGKAFRSYFRDIGLPDAFAEVQVSLPRHLRRPVLFLDRDGVINVDVGYAHLPGQIHWIDGAIEAIRLANNRGYLVIVITNQSGVARGYYGEEHVIELHKWMQARFGELGAHVDQFCFCPHHPEGIVERYRRDCECRKPAAGMIHKVLANGVDRASSLLIGDKPSDIEAAQRAGINGHLFPGGNLQEFIDPLLIDWTLAQ